MTELLQTEGLEKVPVIGASLIDAAPLCTGCFHAQEKDNKITRPRRAVAWERGHLGRMFDQPARFQPAVPSRDACKWNFRSDALNLLA